MDPKAYLPRVLEAEYLAVHDGLTDKARALLRDEIAAHPDRYLLSNRSKALARYAEAHRMVLAGLDRIVDLPDEEFNARRITLFARAAGLLAEALKLDPGCQEAKLLRLLLAETDADTCLHDVLLLEQETLEMVRRRYPRFDEDAPHFWLAEDGARRSVTGTSRTAKVPGRAPVTAAGKDPSKDPAAGEKDGATASAGVDLPADAGARDERDAPDASALIAPETENGAPAPATEPAGAPHAPADAGDPASAGAYAAPATSFAQAALRRVSYATDEEAAWLTTSSPEVIAWLHTVETVSFLAMSTGRYRAAIRYARLVMRTVGYPHRAEGTLYLAHARLEDEKAFFETAREANELLPQHGRQEDSPWFLLGRALLFYKLGKDRPAQRAIKDFAARTTGGAFLLLAPVYHTPYLPVRPEPRHPWSLAHQAIYEADGIILDTPDFPQWAEGFPEVRAAANSFQDKYGFE